MRSLLLRLDEVLLRMHEFYVCWEICNLLCYLWRRITMGAEWNILILSTLWLLIVGSKHDDFAIFRESGHVLHKIPLILNCLNFLMTIPHKSQIGFGDQAFFVSRRLLIICIFLFAKWNQKLFKVLISRKFIVKFILRTLVCSRRQNQYFLPLSLWDIGLQNPTSLDHYISLRCLMMIDLRSLRFKNHIFFVMWSFVKNCVRYQINNCHIALFLRLWQVEKYSFIVSACFWQTISLMYRRLKHIL